MVPLEVTSSTPLRSPLRDLGAEAGQLVDPDRLVVAVDEACRSSPRQRTLQSGVPGLLDLQRDELAVLDRRARTRCRPVLPAKAYGPALLRPWPSGDLAKPNGIGPLISGVFARPVTKRIAPAMSRPTTRTARVAMTITRVSPRPLPWRGVRHRTDGRVQPGGATGRRRWPWTRAGGYGFGRMQRRYRVVIAKPGLDGHDRGAKVIARALRDAGFEVIYTGLHQTPEQVVETALQEDADAVGLSLLSGAHMTLFPRILDLLRERGLDDVLVFGGGIIPEADIPGLKEIGVAALFTPGTPLATIDTWLETALDEREAQLTG